MHGANPSYLVEMAIEPRLAANQARMMSVLQELGEQDPSFCAETDEDSGQAIIKGMDELHLGTKLDILRSQHKIDVNIGAPQVSYRETITRRAEADYTYKKHAGDTGQFARVKVVVEPGNKNSGLVFESQIVGGAVPEDYLPGVEKSLQSVMTFGNIIGFPMVDVKVTLVDGAFHEADSSTSSFEIASRAALREAITRAGPVLLEPVMKVEVVSPEEYLGPVISDLDSRHGQIAGTTTSGDAQVVNAMVPLVTMLDYANDLKSMTDGRATCTMNFNHWAEVPRSPDSTDPDTPQPGAMAMRA